MGLREDGYHLMQMVMQSVSLYDYINISLTNTRQIEIASDFKGIPLNKTNIAYKAAREFFNYTKINETGIMIEIEKNIPSGAGLGGGSADGAAVLKGLNELYGMNLSQQELIAIGEKVGADIPFCIVGGTALVEGIGEQVTRIKNMPHCYIVIAKPTTSINTKLAFLTYDNMQVVSHPKTDELISAIENQDIKGISNEISNVFEQTVKLNDISVIKHIMKNSGAFNAAMTGSGSAVFGIFTDYAKAEKSVKKLKHSNMQSFLCEPIFE